MYTYCDGRIIAYYYGEGATQRCRSTNSHASQAHYCRVLSCGLWYADERTPAMLLLYVVADFVLGVAGRVRAHRGIEVDHIIIATAVEHKMPVVVKLQAVG